MVHKIFQSPLHRGSNPHPPLGPVPSLNGPAVTSLISGIDYWYVNMDKKQLKVAIFLDLNKACDTVDHRISIKMLGAYGIRGISGAWLTSFLTSRKQFCSVNGQKSEAISNMWHT